MIYSMTAFARAQLQNEHLSLVCEIRSINHRYLEISMHLPELLRFMEMPLRESIKKYVQRGKIECVFRYQSAAQAETTFKVNFPLAKEIVTACERIAENIKYPAAISPLDVLRFPNVIEPKATDIDALKTQSMDLLEITFNELMSARGREGEELKQLFLKRIVAISEQLQHIKSRIPEVILEQQERIKKRFADVKLDFDEHRFEQEIVLYSQRVDIAEEVERTETHLQELSRILNGGGVIGRRLDFLLQELNREANTIGAKSVDTTVTHAAVEMKVLIEQIREQVQNIE